MQKLTMPFKKCMMLCGYKNPQYVKHWGYAHYGVDISTIQGGAGTDHNIYASGEGTVVECGFDNSGGNVVIIIYPEVYNHNTGKTHDVVARYMHLESIKCKVNDKITKNTILGIEGKTKTKDYHLHLEFASDTKRPLYSPQVSAKDDTKTKVEGNILRKGTDSSINPSYLLYMDSNQDIVKPTYNPAWLNPEDFIIPKLEKNEDEKNMKTGIDVSSHQGAIDWSAVSTDFAMLRTGWTWYEGGMNIDKQFLANIEGAQKAGIPCGGYIYAYDKTPEAAQIAAHLLADLLDKYKLPYPVAYDFEDTQYTKMTKAANTAICKAFLDTLQSRGYYAMLYTYTNFAKGYLNMAELSAYDLWIADYTGKVGYSGSYGMWQYSATSIISGIQGSVDMNRAYKNYPSIIEAAKLNGYGSHEEEIPNDSVSRAEYDALETEYKAAIDKLVQIHELSTI